MRYKFTKEQLEEAVRINLSLAGVCRSLSIRPSGGNFKTLKYKLKLLEINTSHFTGKGWNVGPKKAQALEEILVKNSNYLSIYKLKLRLFKEGIKKEICENCLSTEWLGVKIPLELHHKDGDNLNHELSNLLILCPNCHALTDTHKGKNKLSALAEKRDVEFRKFGESFTANTEPSCNNTEGVETRHGTPKE
jgi:RNase P subunit RPR2